MAQIDMSNKSPLKAPNPNGPEYEGKPMIPVTAPPADNRNRQTSQLNPETQRQIDTVHQSMTALARKLLLARLAPHLKQDKLPANYELPDISGVSFGQSESTPGSLDYRHTFYFEVPLYLNFDSNEYNIAITVRSNKPSQPANVGELVHPFLRGEPNIRLTGLKIFRTDVTKIGEFTKTDEVPICRYQNDNGVVRVIGQGIGYNSNINKNDRDALSAATRAFNDIHTAIPEDRVPKPTIPGTYKLDEIPPDIK